MSSKSKLFAGKTDLIFIAVTLVIGGTFFCLGKYIEFGYFSGNDDSGSYVYSAAHILSGAEIGVEERPSARMGTLLVNIVGVKLFGFSEFGPLVVQTFLQLFALVFMYIAVKKTFSRLSAVVSVSIVSFYLSSPLFGKFGNVKEQYMIAFMVIGVSFFLLGQLNQRKLFIVLAGAFLSWAPLFKQTGFSAAGGVGLFVLLQPFLKHTTFKQALNDAGLLLTGAVISIAPLYIWIIGWNVKIGLPYKMFWEPLVALFQSSGGTQTDKDVPMYISQGRSIVPFSEQWRIVLRYYSIVILPITLALGSIIARFVRLFIKNKASKEVQVFNDKFVLLLALWWFFDMAFVWISPRSYVQYYLPLNASGAMLGGYLVALYGSKLTSAANKAKWLIIGVCCLIVMTAMSWNVFFGLNRSPYSGRKYGSKRNGYVQNLSMVRRLKRGGTIPWQNVGNYIRENTVEGDTIYVWGWYPGIYVQAQRFSSAVKALSMTRPSPDKLKKELDLLVRDFNKEKPKFIVDSRKLHIPTNRPPYVLWPIVPKGVMGLKKSAFLPNNHKIIDNYDSWWAKQLEEAFDKDEAERYRILKPLRQFVMENYEIVLPHYFAETENPYWLMHRAFGSHIVFKLKEKNVQE